jgi:hypothetical protein
MFCIRRRPLIVELSVVIGADDATTSTLSDTLPTCNV